MVMVAHALAAKPDEACAAAWRRCTATMAARRAVRGEVAGTPARVGSSGTSWSCATVKGTTWRREL